MSGQQTTASRFSSAVSNTLMSLQTPQNSNSASLSGAPALHSPTFQPSSVVNLSNSNNVVIGAMTQYQGPVTIYQQMDATIETRNMRTNGGGITNSTTTRKQTTYQKISGFSKFGLPITLSTLILLGILLYFKLRPKELPPEPVQEIIFGEGYDNGTFPNLGNGHLIVDREKWGAAPGAWKLTSPLIQPIPYVMITHVGAKSEACVNIYKCSVKMRTIQDTSIAEKGLGDISANFYVGNDGNVYVGRGWNYANTYANNSLAVCFMGNYDHYAPPKTQLEAVQFLLAYGIANKHLALDYKLVAHNQTKTTTSPGHHVYKEIVRWPHWHPCGMKGYTWCGSELGMPKVWNAQM